MLSTEEVFTFTEIAARLPRFNGKKIHVSTLNRWCRKGVRGVQLEFRMLGGRMVTSIEAIDRFSERLAQVEGERRETFRQHPRPLRPRTEKQRQEAIARAEAYLAANGV